MTVPNLSMITKTFARLQVLLHESSTRTSGVGYKAYCQPYTPSSRLSPALTIPTWLGELCEPNTPYSEPVLK